MTLLKAFRLPAVLVNRLASLAKATHRSETFYIIDALKHYLEEVLRYRLFEFLDHGSALGVSPVLKYQARQSIADLPVDKDVQFCYLRRAVVEKFVIERTITSRNTLDLIVKIHYDLG